MLSSPILVCVFWVGQKKNVILFICVCVCVCVCVCACACVLRFILRVCWWLEWGRRFHPWASGCLLWGPPEPIKHHQTFIRIPAILPRVVRYINITLIDNRHKQVEHSKSVCTTNPEIVEIVPPENSANFRHVKTISDLYGAVAWCSVSDKISCVWRLS